MHAKIYGERVVSSLAKRLEELTGEKQAERTVWQYIQVSHLPNPVKQKLQSIAEFGIAHAQELLRLKDTPDKQLHACMPCDISLKELYAILNLELDISAEQKEITYGQISQATRGVYW